MPLRDQHGTSAATQPNLDHNKDHDCTVDFDGDDDLSNPVNWPSSKKWIIVVALSLGGLVGNLGTMMCIPAVPQMLESFDSKSTLYETSLVSVWELGEAIGPLLIAPLSEIVGRAPVYNIANVWFVLMAIACGEIGRAHV